MSSHPFGAAEVMMKRMFMWGMVAAGVAAALMARRRGESVLNIAKSTIPNPFGSLRNEIYALRPGTKLPDSMAA